MIKEPGMPSIENNFDRLERLPEITEVIPSPYNTDAMQERLDSIAQHASARDHQFSIRAVQQFIDYLKLPVITDVFDHHTERRKWRVEQSKTEPELITLSQQNRLNGGLMAPLASAIRSFNTGFRDDENLRTEYIQKSSEVADMIPPGGPSLTLEFQAEFDKRCHQEVQEMIDVLNERLKPTAEDSNV